MYLNNRVSARKVCQVFNNNPQGTRLAGRPKKTNGGTVYKQILINAKLQIVKRARKTELTGRSPLSSRGSALEFSVT